jgi:uncharacterized protein DUF5666
MKKFQVIVSVGLLLGLFFSAANVFAGTAPSADLAKPTEQDGGKPQTTPDPSVTLGKGDAKSRKTTYKGTVAAAGDGGLTLILADGRSLTFVVTGDTKIQIPGAGSGSALADVEVGAQALVQARKSENGLLTALRIHIIPGKPQEVHRVGTVTAYTPGVSITIQDKKGDASTFALTANTKILPQNRAAQLVVGVRVTIISRRDVTGGKLTAQGIVIQPAGTPEATEKP